MPRPPIEELDYRMTPLGELILRRREVRSLGGAEVFEVKLGGLFLMSSLVNHTELALATIALGTQGDGELDVLVGGLGLGCTAREALDCPRVRSVTVVEFLAPIIAWHEQGLVPLGKSIVEDPRCTLLHGDFFHFIDAAPGAFLAEADESGRVNARPVPEWFHAVLVDIDHSPRGLLQPSHADFYTVAGLQQLSQRLHPDGVFALWSAEPPEEAFLNNLRSVFADTEVHAPKFFHPLMNEDDVNYIITARPSQQVSK